MSAQMAIHASELIKNMNFWLQQNGETQLKSKIKSKSISLEANIRLVNYLCQNMRELNSNTNIHSKKIIQYFGLLTSHLYEIKFFLGKLWKNKI